MNWGTLLHPLKNLSKIKYFLIAAMMASLITSHKEKIRNHLGNIISLFILSYSTANVWGFIQYVRHLLIQPEIEFRLSGFFGMVMSYAYTAVLPLALISFLCLNPKIAAELKKTTPSKRLRLIFTPQTLLILLILSLAALYLTLTRGALLGALLILPLLVFFKSKKWAAILGSSSLLIIATAVGLSLSNKDFGTRLLLKANHQGNSERLAQNKMGLMAFKENPIFGIGYRSFEEKGRDIKERNNLGFLDTATHAHNNFLEIMGSGGLLSFLSFLAWIFFWLFEVFKTKQWKGTYLAFIAAFLLMGLFQSTVIDSEYMFTFLALYALSFALTPAPLKS
ncbi:MAG: O-antigen ligase family protein [Bdellovibrionota bacterium]